MTDKPRPKAARRTCLAPGTKIHTFPSTGPGNRICPDCAGRMADRRLGKAARETPVRVTG